MTKDEALKLALEALNSGVDVQIGRVVWTEYDSCLIAEAVTAIKEALANHIEDNLVMVAQPEQEPLCIYPDCNCPMDAGPEPDWCARGYKHKEQK